MKSTLTTILSILISASGLLAQLIIGSDAIISTAIGTNISTNGNISVGSKERNFGQSAWHLVGVDQQILGNANPTGFYQLYINGGGVKTFAGNFGVIDQLHLIDGIVVAPGGVGQNFFLNNPSVVQDGQSSQSYVNGMLLINIGDNNSAIYPVGNNGVYTPVELTNISGTDPILGVAANNQNVENETGVSAVVLPTQVDDFSINWNWELKLFTAENTFGAANIQIPLTDEDKTQFAGDDEYKPIVLYQDIAGITSNLDNASGDAASSTDALITAKDLSGVGRYFAGKTSVFNPIVHNIITPNGDNTNDYLVIENLHFFPENEIAIIDRYGIEIYTKSNYVSPDANSAEGEDFTFLPPGNYICILKYNNGENTIKQTIQTISVIK